MIAEASNFVNSTDTAFIIIVSICVFFLVLITTLLVVFSIKYNRKRNKKAVNVHGSTALEVTWTVIPTIIAMYMFWLGWVGYKDLSTPPKDSMVVDVTAQMWQWSYKYDNGVKSDTLYVPLNRDVKVNLHSLDVDHSFYVPAFRVKKDVIPGRTNFAWFRAEKIGTYQVFCAEYCGLNHSYMYSAVKVLPKDEYDAWMESKQMKKEVSDNKSDSTKTEM
ncbi:MAG TPA: cytochrome c oxidase subunit II [Ignavibacteriaceae bacterium]|nr:cytochrome c oxidase subunit II [Ignavibacteriaceae bacterium]